MTDLEHIHHLIDQGRGLLATQRPSLDTAPAVDVAAFSTWRSRSLGLLASSPPAADPYLGSFSKHVREGFVYEVKSGIGILEAVEEELAGCEAATH